MKNFFSKIKKQVLLSVLFVCSLCIVSCDDATTKVNKKSQSNKAESLIKINKEIVKNENEEINAYVKRHNWTMKETGTGLRYMNYVKGSGEKAKTGQTAKVNFKISLLDGTICYSSEKTGAEEFFIGEDHVESGLHEGVQLMCVGDKTIFILPPHLAHGLIGDKDKIPPLSTIVYDIELVGLK